MTSCYEKQHFVGTVICFELAIFYRLVPSGQVSGSMQVVMKSEDSDDAGMEVDVLGDDNSKVKEAGDSICSSVEGESQLVV